MKDENELLYEEFLDKGESNIKGFGMRESVVSIRDGRRVRVVILEREIGRGE